jgi:26S proteasome regulatory subunit N1
LLTGYFQDEDVSLHRPALESLRTQVNHRPTPESHTAIVTLSFPDQIRTATSSMTSVPKPLKFLRPHYDRIKAIYDTMPDADNKV